MKMKAGVAIIAVLIVMWMTSPRTAIAGPDEERAAVDSAGAWLTLIDGGGYAKSWDEAAPLFKASVTEEQWVKSLDTVRKPLGKLISRTTASATYTKSLPGVPDGDYVVIKFNTDFEHKKSAVESVTPMLDKDGKWRVAGYFIK